MGNRTRYSNEEATFGIGGAPGALGDRHPSDPSVPADRFPERWGRAALPRECEAFFPMLLAPEKREHLLSVIRAAMGEEGTGATTESGLGWVSSFRRISVSVRGEETGSRVRITAGRAFGWSLAGISGVLSGVMLAGVLEPITFGVFVGSLAGGLGVALGIGTAYSRGARKRVATLMDRVCRSMDRMAEWPKASSDAEAGSATGATSGRSSTARDIERLEALHDRREAMGSRVVLRRLTYAVAVGASLAALLPIALQFLPTDYPLPWIVVGGLGWILVRTLRGLFKGIRARKALDREISKFFDAPGPRPENCPKG